MSSENDRRVSLRIEAVGEVGEVMADIEERIRRWEWIVPRWCHEIAVKIQPELASSPGWLGDSPAQGVPEVPAPIHDEGDPCGQ